MIKPLIRWQLGRVERRLGESLAYARFILDTSLGAFLRFGRIRGFTEYRKVLPQDAYAVARIVAARDEDCGPCVQIEINLARQAGVEAELLRAVLEADVDALPGPLQDVYRFAEAVVGASGAEGSLRERLRDRHGDQGLVELAYAIAGPRIFPVLKRALGYAKSCSVRPPQV